MPVDEGEPVDPVVAALDCVGELATDEAERVAEVADFDPV